MEEKDTKKQPTVSDMKEDEPIPEDAQTDKELDHLWATKEAYEAQNFSNNFNSKRKWNDLFWNILFWINFIVSFVLFMLAKPWKTETYSIKNSSITRKDMLIIGIISIGVAFVIALFTYLFILFAPRVYVKFSMFIMLIFLLGSVIPLAILYSPFIIILSGSIFLVVFIYTFKVCKALNFSADLLKSAAIIMRKFPSLFLFNLCMLIIQSGFTYLFQCGAVICYCRGISYWIYVYVIISYFWISQTVTYVTYTTCAGLTSAWYFLNGTEYMPKAPIIRSLFNACGPSFGACALAGFLEGIANAFRFIEDKGETNICFSCVKCCTKCCLCVIKLFVGAIDRYSLIYCAMFGIPAKQGVKRWKGLKAKKIIKQLLNSSIIATTFDFYSYGAMAVGACVCGLFGLLLYEKKSPPYNFLFVFGMGCALNGLLLISTPMEVLCDTLFIGFAENPLRLETGAKEIYDVFGDETKKIMDKDIRVAKGLEDEGGCCCC